MPSGTQNDDQRFLEVHDHDPEERLTPVQRAIIAQTAQQRLPERRYAVVVYELAEHSTPRLTDDAQERYLHMLRATDPWSALLKAAEPIQREMDGE